MLKKSVRIAYSLSLSLLPSFPPHTSWCIVEIHHSLCVCRSRPEFFNHFLSLRQDLWLKLELIDWASPVSASLYCVTSVCHKAQLSRMTGGLFSGPHTCTALTHWAVSLAKIISFPVLSHNTWNDQLKKRKGCLITQFQRFQPMVPWIHCVWVYGEAAQWQKHMAEESANHMVAAK